MKKLVIIICAVLVPFGIAFAQSNIADVNQEGGNQNANVTQTGSLNNADVNQFTDNFGPQTSDVIQTGAGNTVEVSQSQTGGGDNFLNSAFIQQIGDGNYGKQVQVAPGSNSGQHLIAYQTGDDNIAEQSILGGYTESFSVQQVGNENQAYQTALGGRHNHGEILQTGNENLATQTVDGSNNGYMAAEVLIQQAGNNNTATQDFYGYGWSHMNNGQIYQTGDENIATQLASGRSLDLQITQEGNLNEAFQDANGNNFDLGYGELIINQSGEDNFATQTVIGDGNQGYINQFGENNNAFMNQTGDMNWAQITQTGNGNTATVTQTNP